MTKKSNKNYYGVSKNAETLIWVKNVPKIFKANNYEKA